MSLSSCTSNESSTDLGDPSIPGTEVAMQSLTGGTIAAVAPTAVPAGLAAAGAAEFPSDHPMASVGSMSLTIIELGRGTVGLLESAAARDDSASPDPRPRGQLGPAGLAGVEVTVNDDVLLVLSRDVDEAGLIEIADDIAGAADPQQAFSALGVGEPITALTSPVPGIGSLPMPINVPGFALSWTSDGAAGGIQRSFATATFGASASTGEVLAWWYGNGEPSTIAGRSGWSYASSAFATAGDALPAEASIFMFVDDGVAVVVRSVDVTPEDGASAISTLTALSPGEFAALPGRRAGR